jgi:Uma2 family endonuclease
MTSPYFRPRHFFRGGRPAPGSTPRHQYVAAELAALLGAAAAKAGLHALRAVNVRLGPARIAVPDVVVTAGIDFDELVVDAAAVRMVCEILAPETSATDRVVKMHDYAAAGIRWYLLADPGSGMLRRYELAGTAYREHSVTQAGELLRLTDPVAATIDPADLLPPRSLLS